MVRWRLAVSLVAIAACAPAEKTPPAGAAIPSDAGAVAASPDVGTASGGCRKSGDWELCSVEDRLTMAGLVVEKLDEPASRAFLGVRGTTFRIGSGDDRLEVFIYASAEARMADTDRLDSAAVSPKGERVSYPVPPLLITSRNLAAIAFSYSDRQKERLDLALSAGLPAK